MKSFIKRTWAEIDLDSLIHNFNTAKDFTGGDVVPVIKADAYGHGAVAVAKALPKRHAKFFAVADIEEAIELRLSGIDKPILILGYTSPAYSNILNQYNLTQTVHTLDYARELSAEATKVKCTYNCHLKIDSGMSRIGFNWRDAHKELLECLALDNLHFDGIYTHFAVSDRSGDKAGKFTKTQFERFISVCDFLEQKGYTFKHKHCCNSAGIMLEKDMHLDMTRLGIMLYGLKPDADLEMTLDIKPVMTLKTLVTQVKTIKKGDTVSYGRTFKAKKDMTVATLCVGYADGYPRALSNKGEVLIGGKRAKVLGRVCMDQVVVDVSHIENVNMGDEVILFGKVLPVCEIAKKCGTINYEVVCGISRRVPRVYYKNGKIHDIKNFLI